MLVKAPTAMGGKIALYLFAPSIIIAIFWSKLHGGQDHVAIRWDWIASCRKNNSPPTPEYVHLSSEHQSANRAELWSWMNWEGIRR